MPSNKPRLYLALYARGGNLKMPGGEDKYHWALILGPKADQTATPGRRFHALERMGPTGTSSWVFEELEVPMESAMMILVRVALAKVLHADKLALLLRQIPIRQDVEGWNCVAWVKEALARIGAENGIVGTSVLEWTAVRDAALGYCQRKREEHRFDGEGGFDTRRVPTHDLMEEREIVA